MATYQRYGQRGSVGARAVLWIVVSVVFLVVDILKVTKLRAVGLAPSWFLWAQILLWTLALVFWTYSGVQSLRKGKVS